MRLSIRLKLVLINLVILLLFGSATMFVTYEKIKASNLSSMENQLRSSSYMLGNSLDMQKVKSVLEKPDKSNPDVIEMNKSLDTIIRESNSGIANLYLFTYKDDKFYFDTMSSSLLVGNFTFGSEYKNGIVFSDPAKRAIQEKRIQTTDIITDQFGQWKSGFFPVEDENGNVIALFGVDFNVSQTNAKAWQETISLFGIVVISMIVSALLIFYVATRISKPISYISDVSRQIANGDLTIENIDVSSKDEIGDLAANFQTMSSNLRGLIQHVTLSAEQVAASAEELTASAEQTSKATEQISFSVQEMAVSAEKQVHSVDQGAKAINEMSVSAQQIASSAQQATSMAAQASQSASEGNMAIQRAVQQMNGLNETFNGLATVVKGLGERSEQIGQFVEIISAISSQTNLLALNAAIEAARAGENGRGFAVVADEIRKLSEQSSSSTHQIAELVTVIQSEMNSAVQTMNSATKEMEEGIEMVSAAGISFEGIQGAIAVVADQINEVSSESIEMSAGAEQVVNSINVVVEATETASAATEEVSSSSEEQLASMEEIAASAEALSEMAEKLQEEVAKFKV
ncbi:methyl-accepting chemotaxis protein [Brevibacillus ginsengisoli]|uniref:methyl-accepting chemotaxis protein n=1 Tax=Brevibacillus ginsengisoli TaxID=363854 RepID=UPI003CF7F32C